LNSVKIQQKRPPLTQRAARNYRKSQTNSNRTGTGGVELRVEMSRKDTLAKNQSILSPWTKNADDSAIDLNDKTLLQFRESSMPPE
jgi:hypothetical protein